MTATEPQDLASGRKKSGRPPKRTWKDLTPQERTGSIVSVLIQLTLAAIAWTDLARRPEKYVRGPKPLWALAITVNFVGPISYFIFGRLPDRAAQRRKRRAKR
jgi:hypothetical protein